MTRFDALRKDSGYAGTVESASENLLSSHAVKRFFKAFSLPLNHAFRKLLRHLFLWRLRLAQPAQPAVIVLGLDTVVLDNDDALKRHGVSPTYKKVKGFQPLQLSWKRFVIDAIFRRGDKHSNHGDEAIRVLRTVSDLIRTHYRQSVPIMVRRSVRSEGELPRVTDDLACLIKDQTTQGVRVGPPAALRRYRHLP